MARTAARLKDLGTHKTVNLVFFNALFTPDGGYNSLPNRTAQVRVFDAALKALEKECRPDLILVGCNTLSVLLDDVPFVRTAKVPVVGIVDAGVGMIESALRVDPGTVAILFGTETTIREDSHRKKLLAKGIPASRIVVQACPELASFIENGWASDETKMLVSSYVEEAVGKLAARKTPVLAALVCTHYGYALEAWREAFREAGADLRGILDPNLAMVDAVFPAGGKPGPGGMEIRARVVSMVELSEAKRASLGGWLERISPETAAALRAYELKPGLFEWRSLLEK
jgi:glutamate racemase